MTEQQLELYMNTYTGYLIRIGYYYTKDMERAKDLTQEVFIKLYYADYEEQGNMKAFVATMMANHCKDYLKSWSYRKIVVQQLFHKEQTHVEINRLVELDEQDLIEQAIMQLPTKLREVVAFYYMEQMTTKEIGELLTTPESTIKTRLQSARKQLKTKLQHIEWEVLYND